MAVGAALLHKPCLKCVLVLTSCDLGQKRPLFRGSREKRSDVRQFLLLGQETMPRRKLPIFD